MRFIKAISQAKQGEWMRLNGTTMRVMRDESVWNNAIGWQDLWSMEESISFLKCIYTCVDICILYIYT